MTSLPTTIRISQRLLIGLVALLVLGGCDDEEAPALPDREAVAEQFEAMTDAVIGTLEEGFAAMEDALDEAGIPDATTPAPAHRDDASEAERNAQMRVAEAVIIEKTNAHRAEHGLAPLEHSAALGEIARAHSRDMVHRGFYAHDNPDGLGPHDRIDADLPSSYQLRMSAENIAHQHLPASGSESTGHSLGERLMELWMESPGHRENILRDRLTHIGVGLYAGSSDVYATQKFIADRNSGSNGAEGGVGIE